MVAFLSSFKKRPGIRYAYNIVACHLSTWPPCATARYYSHLRMNGKSKIIGACANRRARCAQTGTGTQHQARTRVACDDAGPKQFSQAKWMQFEIELGSLVYYAVIGRRNGFLVMRKLMKNCISGIRPNLGDDVESEIVVWCNAAHTASLSWGEPPNHPWFIRSHFSRELKPRDIADG